MLICPIRKYQGIAVISKYAQKIFSSPKYILKQWIQFVFSPAEVLIFHLFHRNQFYEQNLI